MVPARVRPRDRPQPGREPVRLGRPRLAAGRAAVREPLPRPQGNDRRWGPVVRALRAAGWEWGGRWEGARDYQHFSANGR
ncbi:MAG TPA: M15 family metallopeptidase [Solirubrobacterales bacterium]|nr:M15 family metallopeptidase [Solirubrobacterales bacterium]